MENAGVNTNSLQLFNRTTKPEELDGKHMVLSEVGEGMNTGEAMASSESRDGKNTKKATISDRGQVQWVWLLFQPPAHPSGGACGERAPSAHVLSMSSVPWALPAVTSVPYFPILPPPSLAGFRVVSDYEI